MQSDTLVMLVRYLQSLTDFWGNNQGFFSKFLIGGGDSKFRSPMGTKSDGGGGNLQKNLTEAKTAHLMQNQAIFCYFKHEMQLFKVLLSLKVVKFDTKMYLNFSNFRGRTLRGGGGGQAQVQKWGQVSDGGGGELAKFSLDGDPQSPPGKNPDNYLCGHDLSLSLKFFLHWDSWTITAKQHHLDLIQSMYGTVPYANFNLETQNFNKDLTRKSCTISIWRIFFFF